MWVWLGGLGFGWTDLRVWLHGLRGSTPIRPGDNFSLSMRSKSTNVGTVVGQFDIFGLGQFDIFGPGPVRHLWFWDPKSALIYMVVASKRRRAAHGFRRGESVLLFGEFVSELMPRPIYLPPTKTCYVFLFVGNWSSPSPSEKQTKDKLTVEAKGIKTKQNNENELGITIQK